MQLLTLRLPEHFDNPIPESWSPEDRATALQVGHAAVAHLRARREGSEGQRDTHAVLREILAADLDGVRAANAALRDEVRDLREAAVRAEGELGVTRATARLAAADEQGTAVERATTALRASLANVEEQLRSSTQALQAATRANSDGAARLQATQEERDALRARLAEAERASEPHETGRRMELNSHRALEEAGLFVRDTSTGSHNIHFHDKLVAHRYLRQEYGAEGGGGVPRYCTDGHVILSLEDKCYKHSNKLGEQISKFHAVRRAMQVGGRADCFAWYSTASIPSRGHQRKSFEYEQLDDGRFSVTGWLGASDVSDEELATFVREILDQQQLLGGLRTSLAAESEVVQELATAAEHAVRLAQSQLEQVDAMTRSIRELERQRDALRCATLEAVLRPYAALRGHGLLAKSDSLLDDSLRSLEQPRRTEADRLIRHRDEFAHLRSAICGLGEGKRARRRSEGTTPEGRTHR